MREIDDIILWPVTDPNFNYEKVSLKNIINHLK